MTTLSVVGLDFGQSQKMQKKFQSRNNTKYSWTLSATQQQPQQCVQDPNFCLYLCLQIQDIPRHGVVLHDDSYVTPSVGQNIIFILGTLSKVTVLLVLVLRPPEDRGRYQIWLYCLYEQLYKVWYSYLVQPSWFCLFCSVVQLFHGSNKTEIILLSQRFFFSRLSVTDSQNPLFPFPAVL